MRKVLSVLVLLLLAICAASPYLIGYQVKNGFYAIVDTLSQKNKYIEMSVLEYKLGWLSSDAKVQLTIHLPKSQDPAADAQAKNLTEIIESHIDHGPLVKDPVFGHWTLAMAAIKSQYIVTGVTSSSGGKLPPLQVMTLVDFKNNWHTQFTRPAFEYASPKPNIQFSMQGADGSLDFNVKNNQVSQYSLLFEIKGLAFKLPDSPVLAEIDLDSVKYEKSSKMEDSGIRTGKSTLTLPSLTIKKKDNRQITLQDGILTNTLSSPNLNLYDFRLDFSFKNLQTANELLPSVGPLQLSIAANNLNLPGVDALISFFQSLDHQPLTPEDTQAYMKLLPKILTPTTLFTVNLTSNTTFGAMQNDGTLSWKAGATAPATVQEMAQTANSTLNLHVASALVDKMIAAHDGPAATADPATTANASTAADSTAKTESATPSSTAIPAKTDSTTAAPTGKDASAPASTPAAAAASSDASTPANQGPPPFRPVFDSWLLQGYVLKDGNNYVVSIKHENGLTTINGKSPPSP
jgi:uncharacterized protein YdgA (DUF945 family)